MIDAFLVSYVAGIRNSFLDSLFCFNLNYLIWYILFFIMCFFILLSKKRKIIFCFVPCYLFALAWVVGLKWLVARARPFEIMNLPLVSCVNYALDWWNTSFPSWHSTFIFLFFSFLVYLYGKKAYWFLLFAVFYSFARIYLGFHYFSDAVFGGLLGYFIGVVGIRLYLRAKSRFSFL